MPTTLIAITAAVVILRNETARAFLGKIVGGIAAVLNIFMKPKNTEKQNTTDKKNEQPQQDKSRDSQDPKQEQTSPEKETAKTEETDRKKEIEEKHTQEQEQIKSFSDRRIDCIDAFVPSIWKELSLEEKKDAIMELYLDVRKTINLSGDYDIAFVENSNIDEPSFYPDNDTGKENLCINMALLTATDMPSPNGDDTYVSPISIDLACTIVKQMCYQRQAEIIDKKMPTTEKEAKTLDMVEYNLRNIEHEINTPASRFLGSYLKPIEKLTGQTYIFADKDSPYEMKCFFALQPSERQPSMITTLYFEQLKSRIEAGGEVPENIRQKIAEHADASYFKIRDEMNRLHNCKDIESEIDKAFMLNRPFVANEDRPTEFNKGVAYAVCAYQVLSQQQTRNTGNFVDGRAKILERINGEIDEISARQYKFDKNRLNFEHITVGEVLSDEDWKKKYPDVKQGWVNKDYLEHGKKKDGKKDRTKPDKPTDKPKPKPESKPNKPEKPSPAPKPEPNKPEKPSPVPKPEPKSEPSYEEESNTDTGNSNQDTGDEMDYTNQNEDQVIVNSDFSEEMFFEEPQEPDTETALESFYEEQGFTAIPNDDGGSDKGFGYGKAESAGKNADGYFQDDSVPIDLDQGPADEIPFDSSYLEGAKTLFEEGDYNEDEYEPPDDYIPPEDEPCI